MMASKKTMKEAIQFVRLILTEQDFKNLQKLEISLEDGAQTSENKIWAGK